MQIHLAATCEWNTAMGDFFVRGAGNFESEYFSENTNHPKGKTGDFWLWDASTGRTSNDARWRIQAWCKNCSDQEYTARLVPTANYFNQHFRGLPRT